jgi:hypothetical protein
VGPDQIDKVITGLTTHFSPLSRCLIGRFRVAAGEYDFGCGFAELFGQFLGGDVLVFYDIRKNPVIRCSAFIRKREMRLLLTFLHECT